MMPCERIKQTLPQKYFSAIIKAHGIFMKLFLYAIYILVVFVFVSCEVTEPERFYNTEAEKKINGFLYVNNYDSTKAYTENATINLRIENVDFLMKHINVFIDEDLKSSFDVPSTRSYTFSYSIKPAQYNDGRHLMVVSVVAQNKGLLSLNNIGALNFGIPFITYSAESLKTEITNIEVKEKPEIHWVESKDMFFKNYKVVRNIRNIIDTVAVISDRKVTTYRDDSYPDIYGKQVASYQLITNSAYSSYVSKFVSFDNLSIFTELPFRESIRINSFVTLKDGSLILFSQKDYAVKHVNLFSGTVYGTLNSTALNKMLLTSKGDKVVCAYDYAMGPLNIISVGNTVTAFNSYPLGRQVVEDLSFQEIFPGKLLVSYGYYDVDKRFLGLFDLNSCSFDREVTFQEGRNFGYLLTSDRKGMAYYKRFLGSLIYKIDATNTDNIKTSELMSLPDLRYLYALDNGTLYLEKGNSIAVCDQNLKVIKERQFAGSISQSGRNENIAVVLTKDNLYSNVEIYDIKTLNLIRKIAIGFDVKSLIVLPDNTLIISNSTMDDVNAVYYKLN